MAYDIKQYHGNYNIQKRSTAVSYIVVHYTGAQTPAAGNALANCKYFAGGNRNASAHYFIDNGNIYEYADPSTYATWHVGDGHGRYGITNQNSVGIEVCQQGNLPFSEEEIKRLAYLVQYLMAKFKVPAARVVRHYDASRKACPYFYTPSGAGGTTAWRTLHARITTTAQPAPKPKQVPGNPVNDAGLYYQAHCQTIGWCDKVHDGQTAGTTGFSKRMEGLRIDPPAGVTLTVKAHIQTKGWLPEVKLTHGNSLLIGTTGQSKRLEALQIKATGLPQGKKLMYRAHCQTYGWLDWQTAGTDKYGGIAGTTGKSKRIEAVQMKIV